MAIGKFLTLEEASEESGFDTSELLLLAASDYLKIYYPLSYQDIEPSIFDAVDPWEKETTDYYILPPQVAADLGRAVKCLVDRFIVPEEVRKTPELLNLLMVLGQKDKGRNEVQRTKTLKAVDLLEKQVARITKSLSIFGEMAWSVVGKVPSEDTIHKMLNIFSAAQEGRKKAEDENHWYVEPSSKSIYGMLWIRVEGGLDISKEGVVLKFEDITQDKGKLRALLAKAKGEWYYPPPEQWLKKQEWSVLSAMMLFAGIDPRYSSPPTWAEFEKKWKLPVMEGLGSEREGSNYRLLSHEQLKGELRSVQKDAEKSREEILKISGQTYTIKQCRDNEAYDYCNKIIRTYDESEKKLNLFVEEWMEFKGHSFFEFDKFWTEKISTETFLQWAVESDLYREVPWWEEAREDGIILNLESRDEPASKSPWNDTRRAGRKKDSIEPLTRLIRDLCRGHVRRDLQQKKIVDTVCKTLQGENNYKQELEIQTSDQKDPNFLFYRDDDTKGLKQLKIDSLKKKIRGQVKILKNRQ